MVVSPCTQIIIQKTVAGLSFEYVALNCFASCLIRLCEQMCVKRPVVVPFSVLEGSYEHIVIPHIGRVSESWHCSTLRDRPHAPHLTPSKTSVVTALKLRGLLGLSVPPYRAEASFTKEPQVFKIGHLIQKSRFERGRDPERLHFDPEILVSIVNRPSFAWTGWSRKIAATDINSLFSIFLEPNRHRGFCAS